MASERRRELRRRAKRKDEKRKLKSREAAAGVNRPAK